jgi:cytochrome c553
MQNINPHCMQKTRPHCGKRSPKLLPWLASITLLASATGAAAGEADPLVTANARYIAQTNCGTCHGVTGNSVYPKFPRLAGQDANYLVKQLKAFRAQSRGDPDAISYMWGAAAQLDDPTIEALAAYYAAQRPEAHREGDPALVVSGREVYQTGVASQGVPACRSCHGPDAHGQGDFPRLAGQHAQYLQKQLASFQSNMRDVAVMHGVALNLRSREVQAVAAFLSQQP